MIFLGITLLLALIIAFIAFGWKRQEIGKFAARTALIWFGVLVIAAALFVGWLWIALNSLGNGCFNC